MSAREFKYIIVDELFPRLCTLADQHKSISFGAGKVTSAGKAQLRFVNGAIEVTCWGESVGLGVKSAPGDAELIKRMFIEP